MKPVYVDIHIHTSENPNKLNENYDVKILLSKVNEIAGENPILLSLTDHNTINKKAYMDLIEEDVNVILGAEIHIKKHEEAPPYHCHILFNDEVTEEKIDDINKILDKLYVNKEVRFDAENIPNIEDITNAFDDYEFILLPHGGQSHKTFDKAMAEGHRFDTTMEKSLYYNHFEGFTARSESGLADTIGYFKRLGISEFVNLITCSDNYNPQRYPESKSKESEEFMPTWMFSQPTFDGLRLALSESSRLERGYKPPEEWNKTIGSVKLNENNCCIDVELTPGLNVVIGGSSSGKTLFVDSLMDGIKESDFSESNYEKFNVANIEIHNPSKIVPHYIDQNFIITVLGNENLQLSDIDIIGKVFPEEDEVVNLIRNDLEKLKKLIEKLIDAVRKYETSMDALRRIPILSRLIIGKKIPKGIAEIVQPKQHDKARFGLKPHEYNELTAFLDKLEKIFLESRLERTYEEEITALKGGLERVYGISKLSVCLEEVLKEYRKNENERIGEENRENTRRLENRDNLIRQLSECFTALDEFHFAKEELSRFNTKITSREVVVCGHKLSIENNFKLTKEVFLNSINKYVKADRRVQSFEEIAPENLFKEGFSDRPRVNSYQEFIDKVYEYVHSENKSIYKIVTSDEKDFEDLSPGWKSAVLLDLILGYDNDNAPLIIDQPEDNLATDYINHSLVEQIKKVKSQKQIILVSHNATIPMLGDAQNVIVCKNEAGKITIKSAPLEGKIDDRKVLDLIAEITDGGKASIRKRVKKYDLKRYKEN